MTQPKQKQEWNKNKFDEKFIETTDYGFKRIWESVRDNPWQIKEFVSSEISLAIKQERERIVPLLREIWFINQSITYTGVKELDDKLRLLTDKIDQAIKIVENNDDDNT